MVSECLQVKGGKRVFSSGFLNDGSEPFYHLAYAPLPTSSVIFYPGPNPVTTPAPSQHLPFPPKLPPIQKPPHFHSPPCIPSYLTQNILVMFYLDKKCL